MTTGKAGTWKLLSMDWRSGWKDTTQKNDPEIRLTNHLQIRSDLRGIVTKMRSIGSSRMAQGRTRSTHKETKERLCACIVKRIIGGTLVLPSTPWKVAGSSFPIIDCVQLWKNRASSSKMSKSWLLQVQWKTPHQHMWQGELHGAFRIHSSCWRTGPSSHHPGEDTRKYLLGVLGHRIRTKLYI